MNEHEHLDCYGTWRKSTICETCDQQYWCQRVTFKISKTERDAEKAKQSIRCSRFSDILKELE